ncbi:MAG: hypothetical protein AB7O62_10165 [Pirellulales bacterium]
MKYCRAALIVGLSCLAAGLLAEEPAPSPLGSMLSEEFAQARARQGIEEKFKNHLLYSARRFEESRGEKTFSDKTGNCRLSWVEKLVLAPQDAIGAVDDFTREISQAASSDKDVQDVLALMAARLDVPKPISATREAPSADPLAELAGLVGLVKQSLLAAQAPLPPTELAELRTLLYAQTTGELKFGHCFVDQEKGRRTADLLEKMDRRALAQAALSLAEVRDEKLLAAVARMKAAVATPQVAGVTGGLHQRLETPHGPILVGGTEANEYNLDEMADVAVLVDLGGNDTYLEGTTTEKRPVLIVIDFAGDDVHRGEQPGIQGGAILGASLLLDLAGNDTYHAADIAQGSALCGIGVLLDLAGDDQYLGDRRVQGQATGGYGLLLDRTGDDKYRAALLAQGVGGPLGCGMLADLAGADHYFAGGKYSGGYDDSPGFGGWSQGVGVGPRGVANGGIGVLLDGGGDDIYEADYFSHGGGYWFAAGICRDLGGNDQRLGATRENFDGTERTVPRFVRWGTGFGCHYAAGFVLDDEGNDTYQADFAAVAYAWDVAVAGICDLAGDDKYQAAAGSGVCEAHNAAVAFLYDKLGNDEYQGGVGRTEENTDYHPDGGSGNYTLLLDESGEDIYPAEIKNGAEQTRGWAGAMLFDR